MKEVSKPSPDEVLGERDRLVEYLNRGLYDGADNRNFVRGVIYVLSWVAQRTPTDEALTEYRDAAIATLLRTGEYRPWREGLVAACEWVLGVSKIWAGDGFTDTEGNLIRREWETT